MERPRFARFDMRILERYTLRLYLAPLAWCLAIFIGLYLVLDLLGHLDEILRHRVPLSILATYYATTVPLVFVQVAPFACLMATLYTLGNLSRHQELMAMRASGVGPFQIVQPILWIGMLASVLVLLVNEAVAPSASLTVQSIKASVLERPRDPTKPHRILKTIEHLAAYGQGHSLLYARTFDPVEKKLEGIVILQHGPDLTLKRKITAQFAHWTGTHWKLENGTILSFQAQVQAVGRAIPFTSKIIQAMDRPEILEKSESQATFMNSRDLFRYIERLKAAGGETIRKLKVDLAAKPAAAFACLVLTLVGIPFAIQPPRVGTALGLSLGLAVGLAYYAVNAILLALGKGGWLTWVFGKEGWITPIVCAWGAPIGFALWGIRQTLKRLG